MTESADDRLDEQSPEIDLTHYLQVLSRRRWIVAASLVITVLAAALYVYTARPVYSASSLILIEKERHSQAYNEGMMVETTADDYYQTQYKLLQSRSLLKSVYAELDLAKNPEFRDGGVDALEGRLSISPVRRSRLVHVTAESFDPALAARIANTVSSQFVAQNIESKMFISKEILRALFGDRLALGGEIPQGAAISPDALPPVVNSPLIQQLKGNYANLEARYGDMSQRYTVEHPEMMRLKSQMEALKARIDSETVKIVQGMKAELSGQMLGNNVRIIDPAEAPKFPSKPRKKRTLVVAALVGFLLGSLLAFAVDMLDQTMHTQEDVERRLRLPFLGSVPKVVFDGGDNAEAYRVLLSGPKSFTGEALKNIRTMIGFAAAGKPMKSILITSTGQGEGKTFIAISLSMVFAQLGEKVLLIEGDLRRPNLHRRFGLSREKGLSHFLAHGKDASELDRLVQRAPEAGLDVLVSGQIPPNPSELLSTPRVDALLEWARARYDRILIDGTPVFPITDAMLWGNHADAATFVVKFGATNGSLASRALQKLRESRMKLAGAVVNQVTWKANSYGDYYYYYYYYSDYTKPDGKPAEA